MNPTIEKSLQTLANTYDDEIANRAVEALVRVGADAVDPLCALLRVEALDDPSTDCDNSERLSYALKALAQIGDNKALSRAATFYVELERHAVARGKSHYNASLLHLLKFMKRTDAGAAAQLSSVDLDDWDVFVASRPRICAIVENVAQASASA